MDAMAAATIQAIAVLVSLILTGVLITLTAYDATQTRHMVTEMVEGREFALTPTLTCRLVEETRPCPRTGTDRGSPRVEGSARASRGRRARRAERLAGHVYYGQQPIGTVQRKDNGPSMRHVRMYAFVWLPLLALALSSGGRVSAALPAGRPLAVPARRSAPLQRPNRGVFHARTAGDGSLVSTSAAMTATAPPVPATPSSASTVTGRLLFRHGLAAFARGAYPQAVDIYTRLVRVEPHNGDAFGARARAYDFLGDYPAALADYSQALRYRPRTALFYLRRALVHDHMGDVSDALTDFAVAVRLQPHDAATYYDRGNAYNELGAESAARTDYERAVHFFPTFADAYYNLGIVDYHLADYQSTVVAYTAYLRLRPSDTGICPRAYACAYKNRALAYDHLGEYVAAIADYAQVAYYDPNDTDAYYNSGIDHDHLGDVRTAITDYTRALQVAPQYAAAYLARGTDEYTLGDNVAAIADFTQDLQLAPHAPDAYRAYYNRGVALYASADYAPAQVDLTQCLALTPDNARAYYARGLTRTKLSDTPGAISDLQQAEHLFATQGDNVDAQKARDALRQLGQQ